MPLSGLSVDHPFLILFSLSPFAYVRAEGLSQKDGLPDGFYLALFLQICVLFIFLHGRPLVLSASSFASRFCPLLSITTVVSVFEPRATTPTSFRCIHQHIL
ncbi:hypothetical protein P691DRAFT_568832 [Macrolepiota fuliginosa MF-IS2]|uniref:Uncharacterized protein n=1 Tax=Macrolepiota fuliginosa MF-IS2 TaxID=1400762 RepID=A0A9P6C2V1_9AGAR|nr:hypothetical protein P691DRAFT_568832 [Macrolepiota fuliginosa MF-IS2]